MKKIISILLISALTIGAFAGCGKDNKPEDASSSQSSSKSGAISGDYKDGTYSVTYNVAATDRTMDYLTVEVKDGTLKIKEYGSKEDASATPAVESSESSSEAQSSGSDDTSAPSGTEAEELAKRHMAEILDAYDYAEQNLDKMEVVEGAEEHSYRFMRMMRMAIEAAKDGKTEAITLGKYEDGTYKIVSSTADEAGWKGFIVATVENGLISKIDFDAQMGDDDATLLSKDEKANAKDPKAVDVYAEITKAFTDAGEDLTKMFAPEGGATATSSFKKLMRPLVSNMISGGQTELKGPLYVDGTYRAEFKDFDEFGWKEYVTIKIVNDKIKVTDFNAISKADEKKKRSQDKELGQQMKDKTGTFTADEAAEELMKRFETVNGDVTAVENVAGATVSSNNFKLLVGQLLSTNAFDGTPETLVVERIASNKVA